MENKIKIFESKQVRTVWDAEKEDWYFSVVDVVAVLTDSNTPRRYWSDLKRKLTIEGSELYEKIVQLKLQSSDGKYYQTDCLDTQGVLRLVQSIPSPKAEPFKVWLAKVGAERLDEIADPEKAMQRGADFYRAKGYTPEWITQRLLSIKIRKDLTDEWKERGITDSKEYAILTDEMTKAWSGEMFSRWRGRAQKLKASRAAVTSRQIPTTVSPLPKKSSTLSLKKNPTMATGIMDIRIFNVYFVPSFHFQVLH